MTALSGSGELASTRRIPLLIAFFSFVVIGTVPGALSIAWSYMEVSFDVPLDSLGILLTCATLGRLITAFFSGSVTGSLGLRNFLLIGAVLGVAGGTGIVVSQSFLVLILFAMIGAMGAGAIDACMNTYASAYFGKGPLNWLHACFGIGLTIAPIVTNQFVDFGLDGWRTSYALIAGLYITLLILIIISSAAWVLPSGTPQDNETGSGNSAPLLESLRVPAVITGIIIFVTYGGLEVGAGQLSNTLFTESRSIDQDTASFWISVYWGSFTVGRMIIGSIGDRISNRTLLRLSTGTTLLGSLLLSSDLTPATGYFGLALIGFGLAPMFATLLAETPRRVGIRHVANSIGFFLGFAGLGAAILTGIGATLAARIDLEIIGPYLFINGLVLMFMLEYLLRKDIKSAAPPV